MHGHIKMCCIKGEFIFPRTAETLSFLCADIREYNGLFVFSVNVMICLVPRIFGVCDALHLSLLL